MSARSPATNDVLHGFRSPTVFRRMGLRHNPFVLRDARGIVARVPAQGWIREYAARPWDVLVLHGPSGLGKTTAAHFIARACIERSGGEMGYVRTPEEHGRWPVLEGRPEDVWVVDSVQRISRWRQHGLGRTLQIPARVILAGHVDPTVGFWGRRSHAGREVLRARPPAPDADELAATFEALCADALLPDAGPPTLPQGAAEALVAVGDGTRFRLHRALYLAFEILAQRAVSAPVVDRELALEAAALAANEPVELG